MVGNTFGGGVQIINMEENNKNNSDDSLDIQVVASAQRSDGLLSFQGGRLLNKKIDILETKLEKQNYNWFSDTSVRNRLLASGSYTWKSKICCLIRIFHKFINRKDKRKA